MLSVHNKLLKNILILLKPYSRKIYVLLFYVLLTSVTAMVSPILNSKIIDEGVTQGNLNIVLKYTLIVFILFLLDQVIEYIEVRQCSYINNMLSFELLLKAFKHTIKLKASYFQETNISKIMSEVSQDAGIIASVSEKNTLISVTQVLRVIGGIIGLFLINWKLTLLVLCFIPVKVIFTTFLSKKSQHNFKELLDANSKFSFWYGETLGGVNEIKLWNLYQKKINDFIDYQKKLIELRMKSIIVDQMNRTTEMTLQTVIFNGLYVISAAMILRTEFTLGGMFSFILYSSYVIQPMSLLINLYYQFAKIKPSMERYIRFMDVEEEGFEEETERRVTTFPATITFENVCLKYREKNAIDNLSFEMRKGEKVAIIGVNGSGKSSLINLLVRFFTPDSGRIHMDGIDINKLNLNDYRELFAVMNQNIHLFNASIGENIKMYAELSEEKLINSCIESDAIGFIDILPDKFDTTVGYRGSKLSGGEKQKVALARVLAKDAPILILDEATSNYDYESEQLITKVIKENKKHSFIIVISHRPDILKAVDKIIVMDKGSIVGYGSYTDLYKHNDLFTIMVDNLNDVKQNLLKYSADDFASGDNESSAEESNMSTTVYAGEYIPK